MPIDNEDLTGLMPLTWIERQAGVIPYLEHAGELRMVLVTSRRTGRWVFPKGSIDPGMTPQEAAAQEALEEAGLIGTAHGAAVGSYQSIKIRPPAVWTVEVALYPMPIAEVLDVWLEADQRARRFVTLEEARGLLADATMLEMAERLAGR